MNAKILVSITTKSVALILFTSGLMAQAEEYNKTDPTKKLIWNSTKPVCDYSDFLWDSGYRLSRSELSWLRADVRTALTKELSQSTIISRIEARILKYRKTVPGSSPSDLAKRIYRAATSFGLDPFIFSALVEHESISFNPRAVSPTRAKGLTQMTSIARKELKHQFGHVRGEYTRGVPQVLNGFVENYYGNNTKAQQSFFDWTRNPTGNILLSDIDKSLVAGAALLKIYLGVRDGSYKNALIQYNGDAKVKYRYSKDVRGKARTMDFNCSAPDEFVEDVSIAACIYSDNSDDCEFFLKEMDIIRESSQSWDI